MENINITGGVMHYTGNLLSHRFHVVVPFSAPLAEALDARWLLFGKDSVVRGGFTETKLEKTFQNAWLKHEVKGISSLELVGCEIKNLRARRRGDGKEKAKVLELVFDVAYAGNAFPLVEHLTKITKSAGVITIKPAQEAQQSLLPETKAAPKAVKHVSIAGEGAELFAMGKPTLSYKCKDKSFKAAVYVSAGAEGFFWALTATIGHLRIKQELAQGPFNSENEAQGRAISELIAGCNEVISKGSKAQKTLAQDMAAWAVKYVDQQSIVVTEAAALPAE